MPFLPAAGKAEALIKTVECEIEGRKCRLVLGEAA